MSSLRGRLLVFLLTRAAAAAAAVATVSYRSVLAETDRIFDYQLRQMALSLRDQGAIAEEERAALEDPAFDYVVQVWTGDGAITISWEALTSSGISAAKCSLKAVSRGFVFPLL